MNKLKLMSMAFIAMMGLVACGDDDSSDNSNDGEKPTTVVGKKYTQVETFSAEQQSRLVTLNDIKGNVQVEGQADWVKIDPMNVNDETVSSQLSVQVQANNRDSASVRSQVFTVVAVNSKDTVMLTINQQKPETKPDTGNAGVDNLTNTVTDQPALSR
jgi:hypothetical protein